MVLLRRKPILDIVPEEILNLLLSRELKQKISTRCILDFWPIFDFAFDTRNTNVIEGSVVHVSADALVDQKSGMPIMKQKSS